MEALFGALLGGLTYGLGKGSGSNGGFGSNGSKMRAPFYRLGDSGAAPAFFAYRTIVVQTPPGTPPPSKDKRRDNTIYVPLLDDPNDGSLMPSMLLAPVEIHPKVFGGLAEMLRMVVAVWCGYCVPPGRRVHGELKALLVDTWLKDRLAGDASSVIKGRHDLAQSGKLAHLALLDAVSLLMVISERRFSDFKAPMDEVLHEYIVLENQG